MQPIQEAASEFLAKKRIAVTGVSRTTQEPRQQQRLQAPA